MTGQTISAMGVWNVIQALGEKVCEEEKQLVSEHKKGHIRGKKETPVLFEEADGVYVKLEGKDRKKAKRGRAEIKVGIVYEGWKKTGEGRYELPDKAVVAGLAGAGEFHEYREAAIAQKYNLDEAGERILNGEERRGSKK